MDHIAIGRRTLVIAALALAVVVLGPLAGGGRRFGATEYRMCNLEFAATRAHADDIVQAWDAAHIPGDARTGLEATRAAIVWDFAFIPAYGLGFVVLAGCLARRTHRKARPFGAVAQAAALAMMPLDVIENVAMLVGLAANGDGPWRVSYVAAFAKFALLVVVVAGIVIALAGRIPVWLTGRRTGSQQRLRPLGALLTPGPSESERCDVVMKGGITSGIVYPKAVANLAEAYRFVNVGGASAGAVAAAASAAAEHGRSLGKDAFTALRELPNEIAAGDNILQLFQPDPATRPLFEVVTAFLGREALPLKLARGLGEATVAFPVWVAVGFAPGTLLAWLAVRAGDSVALPWAMLAISLVTVLLVPLTLGASVVAKLLRALPRNAFGLTTGNVVAQGAQQSLTPWLADVLETLSGRVTTTGQRPDRPLTLGDLWFAGQDIPPAERAQRGREAYQNPDLRRINLEVLTTSLTHGRPFRIPFDWKWHVRKTDLRRFFPQFVAEWMIDHASTEPPDGSVEPEPDVIRLPEPWDLPVVFVARLSLSFPFLVSAIPLQEGDFASWSDGDAAAGGSGPTSHAPQPRPYEPVWMSDGGIASNFPIHFFDALVPGRPTFGIDLAPFPPGRTESKTQQKDNVFLPTNNRGGVESSFDRFEGVVGFVGAIGTAIHSFVDDMEMHSPGYRDRIVQIFLSSQEGGLNLDMPKATIQRISERGGAAGKALVARFAGGGVGWPNQQFVRLRSSLGLLETHIGRIGRVLGSPGSAQAQAINSLVTNPPSYPYTNGQRAVALRALRLLRTLSRQIASSDAPLDRRSPRPTPELRVMPKV